MLVNHLSETCEIYYMINNMKICLYRRQNKHDVEKLTI